jgi:hypothetical protein
MGCGIRSRFQSGYNYTVPGQWNGQWRCEVKVLGDKLGRDLMHLLSRGHNPDGHEDDANGTEGVQKLASFIKVLRLRHFKIIAVMDKSPNGFEKQLAKLPSTLEGASITIYRLSDFACHPREDLERMLTFLDPDLQHDAEYLDASLSTVNTKYCHHTGGRTGEQRTSGSPNSWIVDSVA